MTHIVRTIQYQISNQIKANQYLQIFEFIVIIVKIVNVNEPVE